MKMIVSLLAGVAALAGVVAFKVPAANQEGAQFVTNIPPGYRDWRLTLLWQIIRGTGFPNQIFSDSWVVGLMEGRPWRTRGQVGNASLGDGSGLS